MNQAERVQQLRDEIAAKGGEIEAIQEACDHSRVLRRGFTSPNAVGYFLESTACLLCGKELRCSTVAAALVDSTPYEREEAA